MRNLIPCLLLACSANAFALSGKDLKEICDDDKGSLQLACLMYIGGVSDGLNLAPSFIRSGPAAAGGEVLCVPQETRHMARKLRVEAYLREHPDQLEFPAEVLVYLSLKEAWPCAGGSGG